MFAVLAAIETVLRVGQAMVGDSDSSASLPAAVVITLVTCPFVVPLVINAFYWHRSIIYIVYVVYQVSSHSCFLCQSAIMTVLFKSVIVVIIFLALVWMAVSTKCIDQPKCVGTVAKLAILCAWEVLPIYVFWKAAQSQKRNECYDMK